MADDIEYGLACPFLNDDPVYAAGVEFGMLWADLRQQPKRWSGYVLPTNEEQVRVAASRLGYEVPKIEPWTPDDETETAWVLMELRRMKTATQT